VPVQYSYTYTNLRSVRSLENLSACRVQLYLYPLWAVQSLETLSSCTVQLYLYNSYGRTVCREPQCLYSTAIPLLPLVPYGLWRASVPVQYSYTSTSLGAVQSVQTLSACTVQLYHYHP